MNRGGWGGHFFANCGTFYDYVLIALPAPWIWGFFFLFLGRLVPVYFILFIYFILDHWVLMDKASYICPIYGPEWRGLWILMGFDFHYKLQANFPFHTASAYLANEKSG